MNSKDIPLGKTIVNNPDGSITKIFKNEIFIYYYLNGKYHRDDGPAIEWYSGNFKGRKEYFQHGLRHRIDGPAFISSSGNLAWYYQGRDLNCNSQEEFERMIKLIAFM